MNARRDPFSATLLRSLHCARDRSGTRFCEASLNVVMRGNGWSRRFSAASLASNRVFTRGASTGRAPTDAFAKDFFHPFVRKATPRSIPLGSCFRPDPNVFRTAQGRAFFAFPTTSTHRPVRQIQA